MDYSLWSDVAIAASRHLTVPNKFSLNNRVKIFIKYGMN
jgi:hypothetical protein